MQGELYSFLSTFYPDTWSVYEEERLLVVHSDTNQGLSSFNFDLVWRISERWLFELGITLDMLRLCVVECCIDRNLGKYKKEKAKKTQ